MEEKVLFFTMQYIIENHILITYQDPEKGADGVGKASQDELGGVRAH